ncbi:hypothetical protein [Goodfellowiella coeruleoviolacea]|uniref:Uncharacterized protein n=1 Tax=Goodfellowiella coeruleoviolacea TaxID=334858 RepID=A0AAE3GAU5_9PSEU|nr:hypothetical protein [Goodfellowiella coeruleoviolacea]MCP2164851.1 hypothetical protein [Goodfellowiella coeruleoviolacea]
MTSTLAYGHSPFVTPQVHAWQPDTPGFHRSVCGIRLADTLITMYPRPTRENTTWCGACYLTTPTESGDEPRYVLRRSSVDGAAHVIAANDVGTGRSYRALCGHGLSDAVTQVVPAHHCGHCLDAAKSVLAAEVADT